MLTSNKIVLDIINSTSNVSKDYDTLSKKRKISKCFSKSLKRKLIWVVIMATDMCFI